MTCTPKPSRHRVWCNCGIHATDDRANRRRLREQHPETRPLISQSHPSPAIRSALHPPRSLGSLGRGSAGVRSPGVGASIPGASGDAGRIPRLPRPCRRGAAPATGAPQGEGPREDPAPLTSAASSSPGSSRSRLQPSDAVTSSSVRQQLSTNSLSSSRSRRRSSTGGGSPSMAATRPLTPLPGRKERPNCRRRARASGSGGRGHTAT